MTEPICVLEILNQWGLGGTEAAAQLRAGSLNRAFFAPTAVGFVAGVRRLDALAAAGTPTAVCGGDYGRLEEVLAARAPHVVHYTRNTCLDAHLVRVCELARRHGVRAFVETNVFGRPARDP